MLGEDFYFKCAGAAELRRQLYWNEYFCRM